MRKTLLLSLLSIPLLFGFGQKSLQSEYDLNFAAERQAKFEMAGINKNTANVFPTISFNGSNWDQGVFENIDQICSFETPSNSFENGRGYVNNFTFAADFIVDPNIKFTIESFEFNLMETTQSSSVTVSFYQNIGGVPGSLIYTTGVIAPDSITNIGSAFGFLVNKYVVNIPTPQVFEGGASGSTYWVGLLVNNTISNYWETTSILNSPNSLAFTADGGATWNSITGEDLVFALKGDCEEPPAGCLSTPYGQYPTTTFTPACTGLTETITSGGWYGEYSSVSVTGGVTYNFKTLNPSDLITISDADGTTILATGFGYVNWTAPSSQIVRFITHIDSTCAYSTSTVYRMVRCGDIPVQSYPDFDCYSGDGVYPVLTNGLNVTSGGQYGNAEDINVAAGTEFEVQQIRLNVLSSATIANGQFDFYQDNAGTLGALVQTVSMAPSSSRIVDIAFGYNVYEITFNLASPFTLSEGKYWMRPQITNSSNTACFWEVSTLGTDGSVVITSSDYGDTWAPDTAGSRASFFVSGECSELVDGCLTAPNGQYPNTTFNPLCVGANESITEGNWGWFGEYSVVSVTSGTEYVFSTDVPTAFITISNASGTTVYATGTGSVTWTPSANENIRYYTHENSSCLSSTNWVDRRVKCGAGIEINEPDFPCFYGDGLASNGPENGLNISSSTGFQVADDFTVPAGSSFTVQQIRMNVLALAPLSNVTFAIRNNASGLPGSVIETFSMAPSSWRIVGSGFGYSLYEFTFDLSTTYTLNEGTYWLAATTPDGAYWEATSTGTNGYYSANSTDNGATWNTYPNNYQQVFFISGECDTNGGGGETEDCSVEYDGSFADGLGNLQSIMLANDFTVAANTEFSLERFTVNIFGNITNGTVKVYSNAGGMPGTELASFTNLTPTSQTLAGTNFGFNIYEVVFDLPTAVALDGGASGELFWIALTTTIGSEFVANYWEMADTNTNNLTMISADNGASWSANTFGQDGAFIVEGECTTEGGGGGETDDCSVEYDGSFADGLGNLQSIMLANDFTVAANTEFSVEKFKVNIFGNITNGTVKIYSNAGGMPGTELASFTNLTPTSQTLVGTNFGFNIYEVVFDLPTAVELDGGASGELFWIALTTTIGSEFVSNYWEMADTNTNNLTMISSDNGGSWEVNTFGQDGAFIVEGECTTEGGGGGETEDCSVEYDGSFADGLGNLQSIMLANDFTVAANTEFSVEKFKVNIFGNITNGTVKIYSNAGGMPGTELASFTNLTPTSQTLVGTNFGFNIYEVVFDLPTAVELDGGASGSLYWVALMTTMGSEAVANYWEMADTNTNNLTMISADNGGSWEVNTFGQDGAFIVEGECTTEGGGGGETGDCSVEYDGSFADGLGNLQSIMLANDFTVAANTEFSVEKFKVNIFGNITNGTVKIYSNAGGMPGTELASFTNLTPTSQTLVGTNFGFNIYEVVFDLPTAVELDGGASGSLYWVALMTTMGSEAVANYWEMADTTTNNLTMISADNGGSWEVNTFGQDGAFIVEGECTTEGGGGGETDCSVEYDGTFADGLGNLQSIMLANDFPVAGNTEMKLQKFTVNIFGNITTGSVSIFENAGGMPGTEIAAFADLTPSSQTLVGTNFGFNIYEVVFDLPTEVVLDGGTSGELYWVGLMTTIGSEFVANYWEMADATTNNLTMISSDGGFSWSENTFGQDGAFIVEGECSTLSLEDLESFDFAYYPNPVKDILNITSKKGVNSVSVFNLAGQMIMQNAKVTNGQINVNALTPGTYIFRVTLEGGQVETFKIIKK